MTRCQESCYPEVFGCESQTIPQINIDAAPYSPVSGFLDTVQKSIHDFTVNLLAQQFRSKAHFDREYGLSAAQKFAKLNAVPLLAVVGLGVGSGASAVYTGETILYGGADSLAPYLTVSYSSLGILSTTANLFASAYSYIKDHKLAVMLNDPLINEVYERLPSSDPTTKKANISDAYILAGIVGTQVW